MRRALNLLRPGLHYRREAFDAGLKAAGLQVVQSLRDPGPGDVLLIWNRYGNAEEHARHFESRGAAVIVAENGYLGKHWRGGDWFSLSGGHHAGAGVILDDGPERWDSWHVSMNPYRPGGAESVIFGQRGIGERGIKSPDRWAENVRARTGGRIRKHPGTGKESVPIEKDLASARECFTWNSAAALHALMMGVPVWCDFDRWIGMQACRPLREWPGDPNRDESTRLQMFRRLAWSIWTLDEIRTGEPIGRLISAIRA
jgi:hypothetical protein